MHDTVRHMRVLKFVDCTCKALVVCWRWVLGELQVHLSLHARRNAANFRIEDGSIRHVVNHSPCMDT